MSIKNKSVNWNFIEKVGRFIGDNGSTLSMFGGIVALAGALYAAYKASDDVSKANTKYAEEVKKIESRGLSDNEKAIEMKSLKTQKFVETVCAEKWAIGLGVTSGGLIFLTKYLDGLAISGLTAIVVSQQDKIKSLVERTKEVVGEEKFAKIESLSFDDLVEKNFVDEDGSPVAMKATPGAGDIFVDTDTGTMFQIERKQLERAIEIAEQRYKRNHELYRDKWWSILGFEPPTGSRNKCWGPKNPFKVTIGTRVTHGITVNTIEYENIPQMAEHAGILKRKYQ